MSRELPTLQLMAMERERGPAHQGGVNPPAEAETDKNKDLKDQIVQELRANLLAICPAVAAEEATPAKLLQSNLPLGVATVSLTAKLNTVILGLQKVPREHASDGTSMRESNFALRRL